jgi:hypothetical protein
MRLFIWQLNRIRIIVMQLQLRSNVLYSSAGLSPDMNYCKLRGQVFSKMLNIFNQRSKKLVLGLFYVIYTFINI